MKLAKLCSAIFLLMLIDLSSAFPQDRKTFKPTLSLKLSGGWGSALPKDDIDWRMESVNSNATFEYWREADPSRVTGEIRPLNNHLPEWELELITSFGPHFRLGFATSIPHKKTVESSLRYIQVPGEEGQIIDMSYRPAIKVWPPMKFRLYYSPFRESKANISISGGIGIYPTEIEEYFTYGVTFPLGDYGLTERYIDASARFPFGLQGGLCFEYRLSKDLAIIVEAEWRHAKLGRFTGRSRYVVNEWTPEGELYHSVHWEEGGTLYYFTEVNPHIGSRFADLAVWDRIPDASLTDIDDIRKVRLDLSRSAIRIGFKIRTF
jgi:hypothetical protein